MPGMKNLRSIAAASIAASAVGLAWAFSSSSAATARMAAPPTSVAVVDLVRLIDKLTERSDWEVQLNALKKKIEEELAARQKEIKDKSAKLEAAPEAERAALRDELARDQLRLENWAKVKQVEIDRERALMWQSMYRNIRQACEKLAQAEGYDLVMVNDGVNDLQIQRDSKTPQEAQAQEQIVRRKVLFAAKQTDVTDKLILRMNNERSTAPRTPGADAGAAPTPAPAAGGASPR